MSACPQFSGIVLTILTAHFAGGYLAVGSWGEPVFWFIFLLLLVLFLFLLYFNLQYCIGFAMH